MSELPHQSYRPSRDSDHPSRLAADVDLERRVHARLLDAWDHVEAEHRDDAIKALMDVLGLLKLSYVRGRP